ncbi:MAG: hypothetical protein WED13_07195 [Methyloceanibacter sp.]
MDANHAKEGPVSARATPIRQIAREENVIEGVALIVFAFRVKG